MAKARTMVGLDVHGAKIVAAVLDAETGELQFFGLTADVGKTAGFCAGLPGPIRIAYEAGPTGYGSLPRAGPLRAHDRQQRRLGSITRHRCVEASTRPQSDSPWSLPGDRA
jgi:hypothetical protein